VALRVLAVLITRAGGSRWIPALFGHPPPLPNRSGQIARDAITVLPVQGAGVIEISPVSAPDTELVRRAATGRCCRVTAVTDTPETCNAIAADVDAATVGDPPALCGSLRQTLQPWSMSSPIHRRPCWQPPPC
jgi:hypothetical protein